MTQPVEGCRYKWPDGSYFVVVATGLWLGRPRFVVRSHDALFPYPLSWWKTIFRCPEPEPHAELGPALLCGRHGIFPHPWVCVHRDEEGNIELDGTNKPERAN